MLFLHEPHFQMPTTSRFTLSFPQKTHVYLECCDISIFLIIFRREAPYRVPYFPQIPTFLVRFPCSNLITDVGVNSC